MKLGRRQMPRAVFWIASLAVHASLLASVGRIRFSLVPAPERASVLQIVLPPGRAVPRRPEQPEVQPGKVAPQPAPEPPTPPVRLRVPDTAVRLESPAAVPFGSGGPAVGVPKAKGREALYGSRGAGAREEALRRWGGGERSESALHRALQWLAANQGEDGTWLADPGITDPERGRSTRTGLTGLALLAFLAAGNTHEKGEFTVTVGRGLDRLLAEQDREGCLFPARAKYADYTMYNHAIATLAVAESLALTRDADLADPLRKAVRFLVDSQQVEGGWDYGAARTGRNDASVTCWVVMALISSRNAGADIPASTWLGVIGFLRDIAGADGAAYTLRAGERSTEQPRRPSLLAAVLFCRTMLGWDSGTPWMRWAAERLASDLPEPADVLGPEALAYRGFPLAYWYYGTLAAFQISGETWRTWNPAMLRALAGAQRTSGRIAGSWGGVGNDGKTGGRTYATSLCALDLAIYYRYLPITQTDTRIGIDVCTLAARAPDGTVNARAAELLLEFGSDAVPPIADIVADVADPQLQKALTAHLLRYADRPQELLLKIMARKTCEPPEALLTALTTLGEGGLDGIITLWPRLDDGGKLKVTAARYLAAYADRAKAAGLLREALGTPSEFVRMYAALALLPFGDPEAGRTLMALMSSRNTFIRHYIVTNLPDRGGPVRLEILDKARTDPSAGVRRAAEDELRRLGTGQPAADGAVVAPGADGERLDGR